MKSFARSRKVAALAAMCAFASAFPAAARDEAIAETGVHAPGTAAGVSFSTFGTMPQLNDAGQVSFSSVLSGTVTTANDEGLFLGSSLIARKGAQAFGLTTGTVFGSFENNPVRLTQSGQVSFWARLTGAGVTTANDEARFFAKSLATRKGTQAPGLPTGVTLGGLYSAPISESGQAGFHNTLTGAVTTTNNEAIYRDTTLIVRRGSQAPSLPSGVLMDFLGSPEINDAGQVAFFALLTGNVVQGTNDSVIYRNTTPIARAGNAAPGLTGTTFDSVIGPMALNDAGQIAFTPRLEGAVSGQAIYRDTTLIQRSGNAAPGLPGLTLSQFNSVALNGPGQVGYRATLSGFGVTTSNDTAIFRDGTLMAHEGNAAPGQPAGVNLGNLGFSPLLNNAGLMAFSSTLTGTGVSTANDMSLWLADGVELVNVAREGMLLGGKTIQTLNDPTEGQLNAFGQLAYTVRFTDGTERVSLFTPDLHWRTMASGSWDGTSNWTLGIKPVALYDVRIDPAVSVTVSGPTTGNREVRSLEVGGGAGVATLSLFGGSITALGGPVRVLENGVLTGEGIVNGAVVNQGTVRTHNLTISGGLTNQGEISGGGRLNADIANTTGFITVTAGETMRISGTLNNSAGGNVEVLGGRLETTGAFSNAGQLAVRGALLRFASFTNSGEVAVSFGTTDVFGNVSNAATGRFLLSGESDTTFFDGIANAGEVRAGAGSRVVYFGNVSGAGSFTGAGKHFFEGTFSPGSSPGISTVSNAVYGAGSTLEIELAGLAAGTGYDRLVAGDLALDGGRLLVSLLGTFAPGAGAEFDILDWTTLSGTFGEIDLPSLGHNLAWNTHDLYLDGTISVAAIPEPQSYLLLLAGLGLLGFAARRRHKV